MSAIADMLMRHEGSKRNKRGRHILYRDTDRALGFEGRPGKVTWGWGHNADDDGMSDSVAAFQLEEDIADVVAELRHVCPWFNSLDPVRQDAITDMVFNLGLDTFLTFHRMIAAIQARNWPEAGAQGRDSLWFKEVGARGEEIMAMIEEGVYQV